MTFWLGIDTATDQASVALTDLSLVVERTWRGRRNHTVDLAYAVDDLLRHADIQARDLAGIAVAIGPGSYTGLRVGLAFAKGVALAAGVPVVGVPTLHSLAAALSPPIVPRVPELHAVLRAGRGRLAVATYPAARDGWPDAGQAAACTLEEFLATHLPPTWVAGELAPGEAATLAERGFVVLDGPYAVRRASILAELGRAEPIAAAFDLGELSPVYLGNGAA
jgi:tRNA threonylcarbamoyladenosine biosynthesis protein TsaB